MDNFGISIWDLTKIVLCCNNRPFDERFDFSNKPTELYSCLSNENSISNLSTGGEQFGISSISNNLQQNGNVLTGTNDHYTLDQQTNRNPTNSNHSSPNQQNPIYEYNLAELALLDNQRAQQYIQQQQNRHRQANTSAKQTDQPSQFNDTHLNGNLLNEPHLSSEEGDKTPERPPPLPPLPSKHLLKRSNYYSNIYSAPPQYTEPDFSENLANHSLNYSNPPQYTPSNVPIYGNQTINTNLQTDELATASNLIHNSSTVNNKTLNSNYTNHHHHHLPHHPNQNSLLTSMDGLRVQLNRTKKQMAAVANSASHLNSGHLNQNSQSNATTAVSNVAQNLVSNLVANQAIRAPQIQRTDNMKVSLKGWLYRLEGAALKQWKRRWFVLGEYCLFYYKDSQEQKMIGSVLLPSYTVSTCTTNEDGIARKFSFKLEHHNLKTHYLAAECVETMHQWMRLITLSATMQINLANYEQLTDGTVSAALKAANINLNRPDSQDMMNMILNGRTNINNNENNKNFANSQEIDTIDQFNSTICSNQTNASSSMNNSSFYNGQRRDSSNLDNQDDLNKLNDSGSESCGFTNYKSRRQSKTSELDTSVNSNQMSAYNSVGLPTINNGNYSIYSSASNSAVAHKNAVSNSQLNQQQLLNKMQQQPIYAPPKRTSHYVNAPPKPKRHQPPQQTNNVNNLDQDFVQDLNMVAYGTNPNKQLINQPDLVDANGFPHDLYSIPSSHRQQIPDENLYIQHRRQTLTRQNASDSGHLTPIDDLIANGQQPNFYDNNNLQMKNRPKSSQEHQFDPNHQFNNNNNGNFNDQIEQLNSPPYRPWSDFIFNQQAQRSQSTTPLSAKQNRLQSNSNNNNNNFVFNPTSINSNNITSANNLGTQSTSHAQLNNTFTKANRYDDEHAKKVFSTSHLNNSRTDSPDYMNIEYFKQQQQQHQQQLQPKKLMQKLELDFEQQEKIYQSVLSKNARLEIENLKNEVAKQKQQLKEKQQQQAQNQSLKEDADDSKLSNLSNELSIEQDILPPPLNLTARSIQRRDSERSARLAEAEKNQLIDNKLEKKIDSDEKTEENESSNLNTDITDDDSDEINLSPNPFIRSQFRRSFMNAVYTQKPHNIAASFHASHAYCGPIDNLDDNKLNDQTEMNTEQNNQNLDEKENDDKKINTEQMTMQQRKEQLQRLLHSDPSIEDNRRADLNLESNQQKAIKPPRPSFKLTKDCFLKSEEKNYFAKPAIIVATPEKSQIFEEEDEELNKSISKKINQNIDQVNQVKKQLAFDLIEPTIVTTKPPRPNTIPTKKRKQQEIDNEIDENIEKVNVKDRIKLLEQQQNSLDNLSNLNEKVSLKNIEPINLTNRLRSNSLTLIYDEQSENDSYNKPRQRHRSFSGQNLINYSETNEQQLNKNLEEFNNSNCHKEDNEKDETSEKKISKDDQNNKLQINEDERDNGYLTMESKLSSNDEIDEHISLSPPIEKQTLDNNSSNNNNDKNDDLKEKIETDDQTIQNKTEEKVNFDEVFSSSKSPINSDEDADDEQSLRSQFNQTELGIVIEEEDEEDEEEDNRKTVDDRFAIYSGLSTIKKAPISYQNSRRPRNDFKLTSALIEQQKSYKPNQLSPENSQNSQIATTSHIAEQLNNLQLNSIQQQFEQQSIFKPQQIVSSSIINCGNNLVFVSNQVSPEMMDPNPAYETFDGVFYGQSCLNTESNNASSSIENVTESNEVNDKIDDNLPKSDENDNLNINKLNEKSVLPSASNSHAPYYYSDLLSEEQKLELKTNEDRPELLSRCTGLNNSKNLGITSLQKLSNKKMNNSQERLEDKKNEQTKDEKLENNSLEDEKKSESIESQLNNETSELSNSISSINRSNNNIELTNQQLNQSISNSTSRLNDNSYLVDDDPVYENVNRINCSQRSQSSIDLNLNCNLDNDNNRTQTSYTNLINQTNKNEQDDYLNENVLRRLSQNYIKQQQKHNMKPMEKLNNSQQIINEMQDNNEDKNIILNNQITPSKSSNSIKNSLNHHKTTPIHLRSPTVSGYSTIDSEETVLINDDYKPQQSSDNSINTLNSNINQNTNKLSWKPNLISHSTNNLNNSNKLKPNNLSNYYGNGSKNSLSSSSLTSSVQSLTTNQTNELNNSNQYYRQQSAPNLVNNLLNNHHNLLNNHGNNLNNNTEKCLANKQLNLNKNINKINNLLNAPTNGQDYVVYENAEAERTNLLALQKQLQQQQQLLLQQQEQLAQLQRQQQLKQQSYIRNEYYDNQPQLPAYSSNSSLLNNSSILNDSTIPFDHHLKNLQNISILQNDTPTNTATTITNKNYHNYQNVFNNQDEP